MTSIEPYHYYRVRGKARTGPGWILKPNGGQCDGLTFTAEAMWLMTAEDHPKYDGEWAMMPVDEDGRQFGPLAWIASGDLEFLDQGETP